MRPRGSARAKVCREVARGIEWQEVARVGHMGGRSEAGRKRGKEGKAMVGEVVVCVVVWAGNGQAEGRQVAYRRVCVRGEKEGGELSW